MPHTGSRLLLYLPIYEGFGLSVIEAIAPGVPVINRQVMRQSELLGMQGSYVMPSWLRKIMLPWCDA